MAERWNGTLSKIRLKGASQLKFWQFVDAANTAPYVVSSPVPDHNGIMVPHRLCGLLAYNDTPVLEDLSAHALEKGNFLRTYIANIRGGDIFPYPNNAAELAQKKMLILNGKMPIGLRAIVGKTLDLSQDIDLPQLISSNPAVINRLWMESEFNHINAIGWSGNYNFGRKFHKNITFFALRDKSCLIDIRCYQNNEITMNDMAVLQ